MTQREVRAHVSLHPFIERQTLGETRVPLPRKLRKTKLGSGVTLFLSRDLHCGNSTLSQGSYYVLENE